MIHIYQAKHRVACEALFKSNTPPFFDPCEENAFIYWLNEKDGGRLAYPSNKAEHYFVMSDHQHLVACAGYYIPQGEQRANLVWGMVHREWHGKGFGKALLECRIKHIQQNYPQHQVTLDTSQHTFRFFEKLGFTLTKITENGYANGLHRYDMIMHFDRL